MKWRSIHKLIISCSVIWMVHRLVIEMLANGKESHITRLCPHPLSLPLPTLDISRAARNAALPCIS